ncbi:MAG: metalloregulator ArsR/SmtB family transcription factor [Hyphomicrobiaceae bacterium]|nr:metalloregulator ArsR/SmtB family transcription factor [Hyphomicrobiaceae bacterium]
MSNEKITGVLSALAEPKRRQALVLLQRGGELCVCELMKKLGATQSRMSRHMGVLKAAGLVLDRRDAQWVRYRLHPQVSPAIARIVESVLEAERSSQKRDRRSQGHVDDSEKVSV